VFVLGLYSTYEKKLWVKVLKLSSCFSLRTDSLLTGCSFLSGKVSRVLSTYKLFPIAFQRSKPLLQQKYSHHQNEEFRMEGRKEHFLSPKQNVVWKIENEKNENENAEQENFSLLLRETGP
jgi:hypothetical protein